MFPLSLCIRFALALLLVAPPAQAEVLARPGSIARLDLGPQGGDTPRVLFDRQRVLVYPERGHWFALVGVPLESEPGWLSVDVTETGGATRSIPFTVTAHEYPVQHLRVNNRRHVDPDPEDLARFERERAEQDTAKRHWREVAAQRPALRMPARAPQSSAFGLRRTFNGEPRAPHRGLDLAAPVGTAVAAPAAGTVTLVGDYFFNGRTIYVDHGQGLISMLCHLSRIEVKVGDAVATGQRIGLSGASGRATGPHIHWTVFLNGTAVDPEALLAD